MAQREDQVRRRAQSTSRGSQLVTAEQIVQAAVRICDSEGIASLTIRKLAADLDIGTMTLYGYYRSKEEILDAIADHILGGLVVPEPDDHTPTAVVRSIGRALFSMMREHPSVVYLLSSRATISGKSLKAAMDDVVGMLRSAGFDGLGAVRAYALVMTYCLGFASYQMPRPWGPGDTENVDELRRQRRGFYLSLPLPEFANLVELSDPLTSMPSDEQFEFGLECLTVGLLSHLVQIGHPVQSPTIPGNGRRK